MPPRSGATPDNITFFIGSIFFTTASFLQYTEVATHADDLVGQHRNGPRSLLRVQHRRIDWWAAAIQLVGTLWFNRTTLSALLVGLGASPQHHPIWRPDALGSICFLVSSWLAWAEECHGPFAWRPVPHLVVDHRVESGRLRRLRRVGDRVLRHARAASS